MAFDSTNLEVRGIENGSIVFTNVPLKPDGTVIREYGTYDLNRFQGQSELPESAGLGVRAGVVMRTVGFYNPEDRKPSDTLKVGFHPVEMFPAGSLGKLTVRWPHTPDVWTVSEIQQAALDGAWAEGVKTNGLEVGFRDIEDLLRNALGNLMLTSFIADESELRQQNF